MQRSVHVSMQHKVLPLVELQSEGRTHVLIFSLITWPSGHSHPFSWQDSGQTCNVFMLAQVTTHDVAQSTQSWPFTGQAAVAVILNISNYMHEYEYLQNN